MGSAPESSGVHAPSHPALWDIETLASRLRVAPSTVYGWCSSRRIPYLKIGGRVLFDPEAIAAWIAAKAKPVRPVGERLRRERRRRRRAPRPNEATGSSPAQEEVRA